MSGTMSQADLVTDLTQILNSVKSKFPGITGDADFDFKRHLDISADDLSRVKPRTLIGSAILVAGQTNYAAPADVRSLKFSLWGTLQRRSRKPWQSNWPGKMPTLTLTDNGNISEIYLSPAPTAEQIADLSSDYKFYYFATHKIDVAANNTTVPVRDRALLLIRATAQAMTELAHHNLASPVQLGNSGIGSMPKNGTPGALSVMLMTLFERMASA